MKQIHEILMILCYDMDSGTSTVTVSIILQPLIHIISAYKKQINERESFGSNFAKFYKSDNNCPQDIETKRSKTHLSRIMLMQLIFIAITFTCTSLLASFLN